jgi:hypothetical protein
MVLQANEQAASRVLEARSTAEENDANRSAETHQVKVRRPSARRVQATVRSLLRFKKGSTR